MRRTLQAHTIGEEEERNVSVPGFLLVLEWVLENKVFFPVLKNIWNKSTVHRHIDRVMYRVTYACLPLWRHHVLLLNVNKSFLSSSVLSSWPGGFITNTLCQKSCSV